MSKTITFRLLGENKPTSWSLGRALAVKEGEGQKFMNYYPGSKSIWEEDNLKYPVPPEKVYLEYNDILTDPATEIVVPESNKLLIEYLKTHPFYEKRYAIHSKEAVAENKVKSYDEIEKALSLIKETNKFKIQAMALAILGEVAYGLSVVECSAQLKEKAIKSAEQVIKAFESENYENKYLSALAFFSGIVKENNVNSAVVWNDAEQGVILYLAKGEKGINKLAELLSVSSDESRLVIQEIGIRLGGDKESKPKTDSELLEATAKYKEKFGKNLPPNKLKDLDWINEKLKE